MENIPEGIKWIAGTIIALLATAGGAFGWSKLREMRLGRQYTEQDRRDAVRDTNEAAALDDGAKFRRDLMQQVRETQKELKELREHFEEKLEAQRLNFAQKFDQIQEKLHSQMVDNAKLLTENAGLRKDIERVEKQNERLREDRQALRKTVDELRRELDQLKLLVDKNHAGETLRSALDGDGDPLKVVLTDKHGNDTQGASK